jgi:hypothetical protein
MLELCVRTLLLADRFADMIACCKFDKGKVSWKLITADTKKTVHSGITTEDEWRKTISQQLDKILLEVNRDQTTT